MPFDLGDSVRLEAECRDAAGTLTTASTAVLTVTLPDGTTATPAVPAPGQAGKYRVDYVPAQVGRYSVRWVFTTPNSAYTDAFDVREQTPPLILSLTDAKAHLNITTTTHDEELRGWIESVTAGIEQLAGVCVRRTVIEKQNVPASGVSALALREIPVLSVTTVAAVRTGGTSYAVADLDVDGPSGVVERKDGGLLCGPLRVTYTAGRTAIPANITAAARIILQHLWRTQYGASRAGAAIGGGDDFLVTEQVPGFGYAIPNRALQLLQPDRLPPGVA